MKGNKIVKLGIITMLIATFLTACQGADVVGKTAKTSFKEVLNAVPNQVKQDEMNGGWSLNAPDGTARFIWSKDYSKSPMHDVMLEFDSSPFVKAGLDVSKLPAGTAQGDSIMLGTKLGTDKADGDLNSETAFNQIVDKYRNAIGYHEKLDHYGVDLSRGNKFEWAKNMSTNDKDIVFVVDPEIFIQAGVDPNKVDGWAYASVEVKDAAGKTSNVMKFLKPFNLK